ncbi:MAG: ATP phosphoribosyltransferase regulatory subunit [Sporomusaceae bacterium]|nr:ATP phosphoribosyltransferase regulatory subunit [Sporomusaceae bacterium]
MKTNELTIQIPYGTRDFLPGEAGGKRELEAKLAARFSSWGYEEVVTPTMEYLQTLSLGSGQDLSEQMFVFFDRGNRILALRPEMTIPIARLAATRLRDKPLPLRLFYLTNVFRHEEAQAGRQCEFYQAGVELMGVSEPAADAEVIGLAISSALAAGLRDFRICLGQTGFIQGLMDDSGLGEADRQAIKQCLVKRDLVALEQILRQSRLPAERQAAFAQLPLLNGGQEALDRAAKLADNAASQAALDNLTAIFALLRAYGLEQYVSFDLGIIRDFEYYTGMVFEGYTPGLGFPFCGGGRYDRMLAAFGLACPATGFAMGIERLLLALARQGISQRQPLRDIYVGWQEGRLLEAIATASQLREKEAGVELSPVAESRPAAEESQRRRGFRQLLYIGG